MRYALVLRLLVLLNVLLVAYPLSSVSSIPCNYLLPFQNDVPMPSLSLAPCLIQSAPVDVNFFSKIGTATP